MSTVSVLIGNSDDKLTQARWSSYIRETNELVEFHASRIYFRGFSNPTKAWQNACWVFDGPSVEGLRDALSRLARKYDQDSIALVVGETELVMSADC